MKKVIAAGIAAAGLAGGSVAVAAVAPFGSAFAQTGSTTTTTTPPPSSPKTKPSGELNDALKALVADGTITQDQADKILAKVQSLRASEAPALRGKLGLTLDKIAGVLGISTDDLKTQLKSGKTLAEIAGDKKDALIKALTDAADARIDQAVTNGKITADQAATLKTKAADRITQLVNQGFKFGRHLGR